MKRAVRRTVAAASLAFVALLDAGSGAVAQTDVCRSLMTDYNRIQARLSASDPAGDALARQQQQLQRAMADHDRQCSTGLFSRPAPTCPQIARKIEEMQANIQRLQSRQRAPAPVDPALEGQRARLIAEINARGCNAGGVAARPAAVPVPPAPVGTARYVTLQGPNGPQVYREDQAGRLVRVTPAPGRMAPPPQPERRGFLDALFGTPSRPEPVDPGPDEIGDPDQPGGDEGGSFRTLCVRSCDGYYFPISYATSSSRFSTDADICRARCPAGQPRLFVHPTNADSETAVAADDMMTPYAKSPNALRYRSEVVQGCTCGQADLSLLPQGFDDTGRSSRGASSASSARGGEVRSDLPVPDPKPWIDDDPDSRWNERAGLVPAVGMTLASGRSSDSAAATTEQKRDVRIVGPKFFVAR